MREGNTLTRTMDIEARQHHLLGMDLGEGPPRPALIIGAVLFPVWWLILWVVIGAPTSQTAIVWVLPPALLLAWGWQRREDNPRRRQLTQWVLALRWLVTGHRPIRSLGRQTPKRHHLIPFGVRVREMFGPEAWQRIAPWSDPTTYRTDQRRAPRPLRLARQTHLVGTSQAEAEWRARFERMNRKRRSR